MSLQTIHPAFRARTHLWKRRTGRVSVEWPHGLRNRPGYFDSPDSQVHHSGSEFRVREIRTTEGHPCELYGKLKAGGYTDYFDCLAGPVEQHGGYLLKFIGDAILAFFPIPPSAPEPTVLDAVLSIRQRLGKLNEARQVEGQRPLAHVLFGNFGQVLYGNVGSSERLDFTIIGEAVNVAARGLEVGKSRGVPYVFTGAFADRFGRHRLSPVGSHSLKGIGEAPLFTLGDMSHTLGAAAAETQTCQVC